MHTSQHSFLVIFLNSIVKSKNSFFRQKNTRLLKAPDGIKFAHTTNDDGKRIVVIIIIGGLFSNNRGRAGAGEVVVVVFSIRALLYSEEEL